MDKSEENRKKENAELLRRMKNKGDNLMRYITQATWFPHRPNPGNQFKKEETKKKVERVGCPSCGCMTFTYEYVPPQAMPQFKCDKCDALWTAGLSGEPFKSWRFCRRKNGDGNND